MFEKFLYSNMGSSKVAYNELIQKQDTKLLQLLDEDSFVSDFKSGSQRLKDFMTYDKFSQLTDLVTIVGVESQKKRGYKFPLVACEMLCSDNAKIQQYFLPWQGVVNVSQKVTKSVEVVREEEVDDDDENESQQNEDESKSSQKSGKNIDSSEQKQPQTLQQSQKAQVQTQQFGQFIEAAPKPKKKVMVKQVVETTQLVTKQYPPLLNKLLDYFSQPINHTLTAYVCKILLNFTNKKTGAILSKLFQNPSATDNVFDHVLTHIGSRSTVQWITRALTIQNQNYLPLRYQLLNKVIKQMHIAIGIQQLSNLAACVCQSFDKVTAHLKTATPVKQLQIYNQKIPQLLTILVQIVLSDREEVATYGAQVFGHLLNLFPIKDELHSFPQFLTHYLPGTIRKLKAILTQKRSKLGLFPVKVLQTYNSGLRSKSVQQWFIGSQTNLFPILFGLVKKYAFNNIFHNEVFKFIQSCLKSQLPEVSSFLLTESGLIQWLEEEANRETERIKGPKRGYAEHIVNLCKFLKKQTKNDKNMQSFTNTPSFQNIWTILVSKQIVSSQKMLGGYAKKQTNHQIMHSKQKILAVYAKFLASAPAPVVQTDLYDSIQSQQLLQQLQRQLEAVEQTVQTRPAQVIEEQKHKAQLIEENQHHKSAFWKVHLDYDINHLMDEVL